MHTARLVVSIIIFGLCLISNEVQAQEGNWSITNGEVGDFAAWAATGGVQPLVGDFNHDGRDDIALIRQGAGWHTVPIAFATGAGNWNITNGEVGDFAGWAATGGVQPLVGDFNHDGLKDIALIRQGAGWHTVPIAFATGAGNWNITNNWVGDFAGWAATGGVQPLVGDFNHDGRDDIALIRQGAGWRTVPIALATNVSPIVIRSLTISRHNTAALTNADADRILADGSTVLQTYDGPGDVPCGVALVRSEDVTEFNIGDGSLDTQAELTEVFNLPGNVKVVEDVNFCGMFNTSFIGCGFTPGTSFITERFTANQEGILWAHEMGHNVGRSHREGSTDNLMFPSIGTNRRRINQTECDAFRVSSGSAAESNTGERVPIKEFVSQIYFEGLPLDQAATYGEEDVDVLLAMLNDSSETQYHENIALTLGMIGSKRVTDALISYINTPPPGPISRPAYQGRVGAIVALGYLVNRSDSEKALSYLLEGASPNSWKQRSLGKLSRPGMTDTQTGQDLSKYAVIALGLSGHPKASEQLRRFRDEKGALADDAFQEKIKDVLTESLQAHEKISREGLLKYYKRTLHR
jgi:FG-GAP-like repeat